MSIQYHKCNQEGCNGFVAFDNADFDYKESLNDGQYVLAKPRCDTCKKEFQVVIHHTLIDFDEKNCELIEELPECGYSEYQKAK